MLGGDMSFSWRAVFGERYMDNFLWATTAGRVASDQVTSGHCAWRLGGTIFGCELLLLEHICIPVRANNVHLFFVPQTRIDSQHPRHFAALEPLYHAQVHKLPSAYRDRVCRIRLVSALPVRPVLRTELHKKAHERLQEDRVVFTCSGGRNTLCTSLWRNFFGWKNSLL